MSRKSAVLFAVLAVGAVGGVASASAAAEGPVWLVNGKKLEAGKTVKTEGKGYLFFLVNALGFEVKCKKLTEKTTIIGGEPGKNEDVLEYSECTTVGAGECTVSEPVKLEADTVLVYLIRKAAGEKWKKATEAEWVAAPGKGELRAFGDEFTPKVGEVFGSFKLTGVNCSLKNETYKIRGSYAGVVNGGLEFSEETNENITIGTHPGFAIGKLEYWIVNEKGEETGEALEVAQ